MSEKGDSGKTSREERLAANLRANLRRRKQAARKSAGATPKTPRKTGAEIDPNSDKPLP